MRFLLLGFLTFLFFGCTQIESLYKSCPASCDDGIACTQDVCSAQTRFECSHVALSGPQPFCSSNPGTCKIQTCKDGGCVVEDIPNCCGNLLCESRETPSNCPLDCESTVELSCTVADPLVPILLELEEELGESFITCTVTNRGAKPVALSFEGAIPNITIMYQSSLSLDPGQSHELHVPVLFVQGARANEESKPVSFEATVLANGIPIQRKSYATTLSSHRDIVWEYGGRNLQYSSLAWVTPRAQCVERLLANAKELNPNRALPGYAGYDSLSYDEQVEKTYEQAESIYNAIKGQGISYLNTPISFDASAQRVRLPSESLHDQSGNCIDASLLFVSAFEALGMESIIVFVPAHSFVGVEAAPGSGKYLFIETTFVGTESFESARLSADEQFEEAQDENTLEVVHLSDYRGEFTPFSSDVTCNLATVCSDGSRIGECAEEKPYQCMGSMLIENPLVCGCPAGTVQRGTACEDAIIKNETFVLRSGFVHYVGGSDEDTGLLVSSRFIINSDVPLEVYVVPATDDYQDIAARRDYNHYPSCRAFGALTYDQVCTYPNTGGIVLENANREDARVTLTILATS